MQKSIISAKVVENLQISNISKKKYSYYHINDDLLYYRTNKIWSQFYQ